MAKPSSDLSSKITEINLRLKMDGFGVRIAVRGKNNYLSLVATLPPKPDSPKAKPYQQRISLGYAASVPGIRRAETQARLLGSQLINQSFSWGEWLNAPRANSSAKTGIAQLASYKTYVFENRLNTSKYDTDDLEALWRHRYLNKGLKRLNIDRPVSLKDFEAVARDLKPGTAHARYSVVELRHFAKFCRLNGVDECLKPYQGSYTSKYPKNERVIPTDEEIENLLTKIINPEWRYVFGMMATFGLRNHEVWSATLQYRTKGERTFPVCKVSSGKTGAREVYPMPSRWVETFNLDHQRLPELSAPTVKFGDKTARAFRRQCERIENVPEWRPYSLRHAYAIRCITAGLPDAVSSKWLGHSIVTFRDIYSKWINRNTSEDVWLELNI